jgi:hypothetical protein
MVPDDPPLATILAVAELHVIRSWFFSSPNRMTTVETHVEGFEIVALEGGAEVNVRVHIILVAVPHRLRCTPIQLQPICSHL